jgi:tripartite-type tricarboxylate transporter receptor subunit TctC
VPYKSNGPALNDLLAGQIDAVIDQIPASIGHIRNGRLRAIAVTTAKRSPQLPDTPTLAEMGVKDFAATTPLYLMAPAGTPPAIVQKLNEAVASAVAEPAFKEKMAGLGADTEAVPLEPLMAILRGEDKMIADLAATGLLKTE